MAGITEDAIQEELQHRQLVDITTTGRVTGEPRRIEIALHNLAGRLYISGMASRRQRSWLRNLAADPHFTLHLKGSVKADLPAAARIITDVAERRRILPEIARVWGIRDVENMVEYSPLIEVTIAG